MKSIAELEAIKNKFLDNVNLRKERENGVRIVIGMATCGIAAGARPVMTAFLEEVSKRGLQNVVVEPPAETPAAGADNVAACLDLPVAGQILLGNISGVAVEHFPNSIGQIV